MNHLGSYFHDQRIHQHLSLGQVARLMGSQNVSKAANKICRFEREGNITDDFLATLADALGIDYPTVERLIEQDRQEHLRAWEAWVSEPVPMQLIAKLIPAVYARVPLPAEITTPEQAEAFACAYAMKHKRQVCLPVSRRLSIWVDREGLVYARTEASPDQPNQPWMCLRGDRRKFLFNIER